MPEAKLSNPSRDHVHQNLLIKNYFGGSFHEIGFHNNIRVRRQRLTTVFNFRRIGNLIALTPLRNPNPEFRNADACPHYRSENHFGKSGFSNFVLPPWNEKAMISFIADWHSNLRHRARFEAPPLKSFDRDIVENPIPGDF